MQIQAVQADITSLSVDAIVNAANTSLLGGGGVDGAIHRKGGKAILEACVAIRNRQGGCKVGEAVLTTAGNLPAKWVIHTVAPVWNGGEAGERPLLEACYQKSCELAVQNACKTLAFPNLGTGIYKFPKQEAVTVVLEWLKKLPASLHQSLEKLIFVCFEPENLRLYASALQTYSENTLQTIIEPDFAPAGLRGDRYFWIAFHRLAENFYLPDTLPDFEQALAGIFETLTGKSADVGGHIFVEAYNKGGMSSGLVSTEMWKMQGIPQLVKNFRIKKGL